MKQIRLKKLDKQRELIEIKRRQKFAHQIKSLCERTETTDICNNFNKSLKKYDNYNVENLQKISPHGNYYYVIYIYMF